MLMDHPNILRCVAAWEEGEHVYLQLELCERGSLASYLRSNPALSDDAIWRFLLDIALGVQHVHSRGYVHLDLKPDK
jgi:serine/threonine protein kinase